MPTLHIRVLNTLVPTFLELNTMYQIVQDRYIYVYQTVQDQYIYVYQTVQERVFICTLCV